jgi:fibronectin type 3 domain-containing protein
MNLKYATKAGVTWTTQLIDSKDNAGYGSSIALDQLNHPHIIYHDVADYQIRYAYWNGTDWEKSTIESQGSSHTSSSIALDSSNNPHICYSNKTDSLNYTRWNGLDWINESVDIDGVCTSIALDNNDLPHIIYYSSNGEFRYVYNTGINWIFRIIGIDSYRSSLALDSNDNPHITYWDNINGNLSYIKWNETDWDYDTIDSGGVGATNAIDIDSHDNPHISYDDYANEDLKYARWTGNSWKIYVVDAEGSVGSYSSIALDKYDIPHFAYYDRTKGLTRGDLKYAVGTPSPPDAPLNLNAAPGDSEITLTWKAPVSDGGSVIYNYSIYRGTSSGGEVFLTNVGNVLSFVDTGLNNGQTYYYQVSATNTAGEGPLSNEASSVPMTIPAAPTIQTISSGNSEVILTWSAPIDDGGSHISNYRIYRGNASDSEAFIDEIGNVLTYTDTGLTNGVAYYYKISAGNAAGEGPLSNEVSGTPIAVPMAPTNLTVTPGAHNTALSWDPPTSDGGSAITNYRIYRGTSPGDLVFLIELDNETFSYTDTGLSNGKTYYYQVSAVNAAGEGANTTEMSAIPAGKGFLEEFWWVLLLLFLIVIIVLLVLFFLRRRQSEEELEPEFDELPVPPAKAEEAPPIVAVAKIKDIKTERPKGKMPSPETVKAAESIEAQAKTPAIPRKVVKKPVQKVYQKRKVVKEPKDTKPSEEKEKE